MLLRSPLFAKSNDKKALQQNKKMGTLKCLLWKLGVAFTSLKLMKEKVNVCPLFFDLNRCLVF